MTMRPRGPFSDGSEPSSGPKACVDMIGPTTLTSIWRRNSSAASSSTGPATAMPALLTRPASVSPFRLLRTSRAAASTAASSVTSNISGVKFAPNSLLRRSPSACLRTLPNTRNPRSSSNFAVAQPMPVDAPVMTTDFMAEFFSQRFSGTQRRKPSPQLARLRMISRAERFDPCLRYPGPVKPGAPLGDDLLADQCEQRAGARFRPLAFAEAAQLQLHQRHPGQACIGLVAPADARDVDIERFAALPAFGQLRLECHGTGDADHGDPRPALAWLQRLFGDGAPVDAAGHHDRHPRHRADVAGEIEKIGFAGSGAAGLRRAFSGL